MFGTEYLLFFSDNYDCVPMNKQICRYVLRLARDQLRLSDMPVVRITRPGSMEWSVAERSATTEKCRLGSYYRLVCHRLGWTGAV